MKTVRRPPYPKWNPGYFPCSSLTPLPLSSRRPSVSFGGFGLKRFKEAAGLSSRELAPLLETAPLTVKRWDTGVMPSYQNLMALLELADHLGLGHLLPMGRGSE